MYDLNSNTLEKTGVTASALAKALNQFEQNNLSNSVVEAVVLAEQRHSINSLFILALACSFTNFGNSMGSRLFNNIFGGTYFFPDYKAKWLSQAICVKDFTATLKAGYFDVASDQKGFASIQSVVGFLNKGANNNAGAMHVLEIMNGLADFLDLAPQKNSAGDSSESSNEQPDEPTKPDEVAEIIDAVENSAPTQNKDETSESGKKNGRRAPSRPFDTLSS